MSLRDARARKLVTEVDTDVYRTLLESTKAIPWKIDWETMTFAYIGPQIEDLLGWSPESWQTVNDWAARMHPDDRQRVVDFCVSQSKAGVDHEADYRALTKDGGYVWLRDVVHVVRDPTGKVLALVGFMFDISERKKSEEQLLALQKELEDLSFKDGLTGLANRRRFDARLEMEWGSARRNQRPLSLLVIDIDHFKQFNDHYGHLAGDECLKRVAGVLARALNRPRDLVARFGGEEFTVILPETEAEGALHLAQQCHDAVLAEAVPHARSLPERLVTVSIGVGTVTPMQDDGPARLTAFVDEVDRRLYRAKQAGRNTVVGA